MITHRNEEVKKEFSSLLHFHLHRATPLEGGPGADDQGQVMRSKLGISVRCMGICISSAGEDGAALDTGLQALLPQGQALQLWQAVFLCSAAGGLISLRVNSGFVQERNLLDGCLFQDHRAGLLVQNGSLHHLAINIHAVIFQLPGITSLVVQESWVIVALVQIFKDEGEDLRLLVGQIDSFAV
jgi:hypothetical protein